MYDTGLSRDIEDTAAKARESALFRYQIEKIYM